MFDTLAAELETSSPCSAEREWADCSGAVLGVLVANGLAGLEQLPDSVAGDTEAFELARATMRVEGWALAGRAKAVAQVYARTLAEHQRSGQARASHRYDDAALTRSEVAANLSLELTISLTAADLEVRFALALERHPAIAVALATGRIHCAQARALVAELAGIQRAVGAVPGRPRAADRPGRPHQRAGPRPRAASARRAGLGPCRRQAQDHRPPRGRRPRPGECPAPWAGSAEAPARPLLRRSGQHRRAGAARPGRPACQSVGAPGPDGRAKRCATARSPPSTRSASTSPSGG